MSTVADPPAALWGMPVRLSTFVPRDTFLIVNARPDGRVEATFPGGRTLIVNPNARDRFGYLSPFVRAVAPAPLYTRHTLGEHELARDVRRRRRGAHRGR